MSTGEDTPAPAVGLDLVEVELEEGKLEAAPGADAMPREQVSRLRTARH